MSVSVRLNDIFCGLIGPNPESLYFATKFSVNYFEVRTVVRWNVHKAIYKLHSRINKFAVSWG